MSQFEPRPFGKYFLTDRIAVGGMAEIYKAKTFGVNGFEKTLAIKKILANFSADKEFTAMLTDEAKLVVSLSHPNIVQIYDLGRVGSDYFISMEFIDGVNLRELINRGQEIGKQIPTDVAIYLASEICKGLDYAHNKRGVDGKSFGIVHRDVSPHNILVSFEGDVKIVDFGIAKAVMNVSTTQMGTLKGKVTYMSPEQAVGKPVDHRTDVFSCGIVLYELLSFERLFSGDSQIEVLNVIRSTHITEEQLRKKVPEPALKVLAKALAHEPKNRYQSASDMQVDLTRLLYSRYQDFTPRKLSQLLSEWYGPRGETTDATEAALPLPAYDTASIMLNSMKDQVNIVHRESKDEESLRDTLGDGGVSPRDFMSQKTEQDKPIDEATERVPIRLQAPGLIPEFKRFGLIVFVTLICLLAGYAVFDFARHIKPDQHKPQVIEKTSVDIVSDPSGAEVYLDGRDTGQTTPTTLADLELKHTYKLALSKTGYDPLGTNVSLDSKSPLPLKFTLTPQVLATYGLMVKSTPIGAKVTLGGIDTGHVTPAELKDFKTGTAYQLVVTLDGYQPYVAEVRSDTAKDQIIDVSLTKIETTPTPITDTTDKTVTTPLTLTVTKDTVNVPTTPQQVKAPTKINTAVPLQQPKTQPNPQVQTPHEPQLVESKTSSASVARLRIDSSPRGASVRVNGAPRGVTPIVVSDLPKRAGLTVEVTKKGYQNWQRSLNLTKDYTEINATLISD